MCDEDKVNVTMTVGAASTPRFIVSANKSMYFSAGYETVEEALSKASELVNEGYAITTIRDRDNDSEGIW
jgi:hypothetical protein